MKLYLTSPIPPSVNHYLGYRGVMRNNRPFAVSYKTPEALKYKNKFRKYVKDEVKRQGLKFKIDKFQHFYVDAYFYFGKRGQDPNNYFKVMLDAITETQLVWADDDIVCERVQRILYDAENPRVELVIYPVEYIGIFDNVSQLEEFTSNCIGCTRYSRNCSILNKAKIGRIQKEIINNKCSKYTKKRNDKK